MVFQLVKARADLDNIEYVSVPLDHDWRLDVEIDGEVRKNILVCRENIFEIPNSRNGFTNLLLKVDKNVYATITILDLPSIGGWKLGDEEKGIVCFECRGCSILDWHPSGFYTAKSANSNHLFTSVDLDEGEWCDFDPESKSSVSILNVTSRVEVFKK